MSKLPWFKFHVRDWVLGMGGHPAFVRGTWVSLLCVLHNEGGSSSKTHAEWASALGVGRAELKAFVDYLTEKMPENIVSDANKIKFKSKSSNKISNKREKNRIRVARFRAKNKAIRKNTPKKKAEISKGEKAADRRKRLFVDLQDRYHPERAFLQATIARAEYSRILTKESVLIKSPKGKAEAEEKRHLEMVEYIEKILSKSKTWQNNGKYLQGLGKFLLGKAWERPQLVNKTLEIKSSVRDTQEDIYSKMINGG